MHLNADLFPSRYYVAKQRAIWWWRVRHSYLVLGATTCMLYLPGLPHLKSLCILGYVDGKNLKVDLMWKFHSTFCILLKEVWSHHMLLNTDYHFHWFGNPYLDSFGRCLLIALTGCLQLGYVLKLKLHKIGLQHPEQMNPNWIQPARIKSILN